ncbi:MAG: GFA family protein [Gammaproteobacteria bacterium]|jgi:hypothetical protein
MTTGSCLCGDIGFVIDGALREMGNCHCSMCRKFHGSAFATFGIAPPEQFRWTVGEEKIVSYASSPGGGRVFCPRCGSAVPAAPPGAPFVLVPVGTIDEDPGGRPELHFFVGSKAPWYTIHDDLPRHEAWPPQFGEADVVERPAREPETAGATAGSCLCGVVTFEFDGVPERMLNCYCSRCRKATGGAHSTLLFVASAAFRWLGGEEEVVVYEIPDAVVMGSAFCRICGSPMPRAIDSRGVYMIPGGCLDTDPAARPSAHIFVDSKAPWVAIHDDVPQFAEYPTS